MEVLHNDYSKVPREWGYCKWAGHSAPSEGALYVVHPLDATVDEWLDKAWISSFLENGAILFLSSQPRCGLTKQDAEQRQRVHRDRIHFLNAGHSAEAPYAGLREFLVAAAGLQPGQAIPWARLYATTDPNFAQRLKEKYGET